MLGTTRDARILLLHPAPHRLGVLLVVAACGTLGGETPSLEVFAARALRKRDAEGLFDQVTDGPPRPESKGHLELIRGLVRDHLLDREFLRWTQAAASASFASSLGGKDGAGPFQLKGRNPAPDAVVMNLKQRPDNAAIATHLPQGDGAGAKFIKLGR